MTKEPEKKERAAAKYLPESYRELPQSRDAEMAVLCSILLDTNCIEEVEAKIDSRAFHIPAHGFIFEMMVAMSRLKMPIDIITLTQRLADENLLEQVGGPAYVTELLSFVPTAANLQYYLNIVLEKHILRSIIQTCTDGAGKAYNDQDIPASDLLDELQTKILQIGAMTSPEKTAKHIKEGLFDALDAIEQTFHNRGKCMHLATGLVDLDRMTGGLKPGQMIVIAGRPAMGKTAIALNIAVNIAWHKPVLFFSLEMGYEELSARALCCEAELSLKRVRDGFMSPGKFNDLARANEKLSQASLYIDDTAALSIQEFRRRARKMVKKLNCSVIIIDYLQLMRSTSKRAQGNREQEVSEISAGIKQTAKELGIPIIVLAQLNREADKRPDKRPQISDLRESGSIEQDADIVAMPYREEYYIKNEEKRKDKAEALGLELEQWQRLAELIIGKQRNGPVGTVKLWFDAEYARFTSRTEKLYSNNQEEHQE